MAANNYTMATEFILLGLTDRLEVQVPLFVIFLLIYILTLAGNMGMIVLIRISPRLHTPMYFFLSNLSVVDLCYSSIFAPRLLMNLAQSKIISYAGCITQHCFFVVFVSTEGFLLAAMAYDRYIAICNPLLYTAIMSKSVCIYLVAGAYFGGILNSITHTSGLLRLSFCAPSIINHFFCDTPAMLKLSCSDTHVTRTVHFILSTVIALTTFLIVLVSYIAIVFAIMQIRSAQGRYKAFSTCASHLTTVTIFFGTIIFMYIRPGSSFPKDQDKIVSVFYTLVTSLLNPLIYSLRNKDVKDAVCRIAGKVAFLK
uniref:Olfactory receptor n=1 Tax=Podarcis muralis TaxID=64176 RepID=A0A670IWA4_PODMU